MNTPYSYTQNIHNVLLHTHTQCTLTDETSPHLCLLDALLQVGDDGGRDEIRAQGIPELLDLFQLIQNGHVQLLHLLRQLRGDVFAAIGDAKDGAWGLNVFCWNVIM